MSKNRDAYVIHAGNPCRPGEQPALTINSDITFRLQKYHYEEGGEEGKEEKKRLYRPIFRREVPINLHLNHLAKDSKVNCTLPVLFDAYPRPPLPKALTIDSRTDPILRQLSPELRLVFRYDPARDVGVLVHFGYDFAELDVTPLLHLWMSADNTEQDRIIQTIASSNP